MTSGVILIDEVLPPILTVGPRASTPGGRSPVFEKQYVRDYLEQIR